MNNESMTLKLFDYLTSARYGTLPLNYHIKDAQDVYFLEDLMKLPGISFQYDEERKSGVLRIEKQDEAQEEMTRSIVISQLLELLQVDPQASTGALIKVETLKDVLFDEYDALSRKMVDVTGDLVILNDWQQLLLSVEKVQLATSEVVLKIDLVPSFIEKLLESYQSWLAEKEKEEVAQVKRRSVNELYDRLVDLSTLLEAQLQLGIGLFMKDNVKYPLLTVEAQIEVLEGVHCDLSFSASGVKLEKDLLEQLLYDKQDLVDEVDEALKKQSVSPFDDGKIDELLAYLVKEIDPAGVYSRERIAGAQIETVVCHQPVLFVKGNQDQKGCTKVETFKKVTQNSELLTDVVHQIVNPYYVSEREAFLSGSHFNEMAFPLAEVGVERKALRLLMKHHAAVVGERPEGALDEAALNLMVYLLSVGKRVLVVSENHERLKRLESEVSRFLPKFAAAVYDQADLKVYETERQVDRVAQKKEVLKNWEARMKQTLTELEERILLAERLIGGRLSDLGQKVFFQDEYYYPYEVAQLISRVEAPDDYAGDVVEGHLSFPFTDGELKEVWKLRKSFTSQNLELLKYDFLDVDHMCEQADYVQFLEVKVAHEALVHGYEKLSDVFGGERNTAFVEYLSVTLPVLVREVDAVKKGHYFAFLQEAMLSMKHYDDLVYSVERLNQKISDIYTFKGDEIAFREMTNALNEMLRLPPNEGVFTLTDDPKAIIDFYFNQKTEVLRALQTAHAIWNFNDEASSLSKHFKGITSDGLETLPLLKKAAEIHLSERQLDAAWQKARTGLKYELNGHIEQKSDHPINIEIAQMLASDCDFETFDKLVSKVKALIASRESFTIFAAFIDGLKAMMPKFTADLVSRLSHLEDNEMPEFKAVFEYSQVKTLLDSFDDTDLNAQFEALNKLHAGKEDLQRELLSKKCWDFEGETFRSINAPFGDNNIAAKLMSVPLWFVGISDDFSLPLFKEKPFDVTLYMDGHLSNIFQINQLMHAHKVIVFGTDGVQPTAVPKMSADVEVRLSKAFGTIWSEFGRDYLTRSILDLMSDSAAFEAKVDRVAREKISLSS